MYLSKQENSNISRSDNFRFFICRPVRTNSDLKTSQTIPDDIQYYDIVLLSILLPTKSLILKPTKVSSIPEQYRLRIFLLLRISLLQCITIPLPSEIKFLIAVLIQKILISFAPS